MTNNKFKVWLKMFLSIASQTDLPKIKSSNVLHNMWRDGVTPMAAIMLLQMQQEKSFAIKSADKPSSEVTVSQSSIQAVRELKDIQQELKVLDTATQNIARRLHTLPGRVESVRDILSDTSVVTGRDKANFTRTMSAITDVADSVAQMKYGEKLASKINSLLSLLDDNGVDTKSISSKDYIADQFDVLADQYTSPEQIVGDLWDDISSRSEFELGVINKAALQVRGGDVIRNAFDMLNDYAKKA